MPIPASELWRRIRKEMAGQPESRQIAILRRYLAEWPMDFKGPYQALRAKLVDTLAELERVEAIRRSSGRADVFHVKRAGAAQIAAVGLANAGKSALVSSLTAASTKIGVYPFTTQLPIPGMMEVEDIPIQLVDTPAVVRGLTQGEGPGRLLLQCLRQADGLALVVDLSCDPLSQVKVLLTELRKGGVEPYPGRLQVVVRPKGKGRVEIRSAIELDRGEENLIRLVLQEAGIHAAQVWVRVRFKAEDIEVQLGASACKPTLLVGSKNNEPGAAEHFAQLCTDYPLYPAVDVNCFDEAHLPELRAMLFELLGLMRIYRAAEDGTPDGGTMPVPLGATVADFAEAFDRRLACALMGAKVWGTSVRFPGQLVGLAHTLAEGDAVWLRTE